MQVASPNLQTPPNSGYRVTPLGGSSGCKGTLLDGCLKVAGPPSWVTAAAALTAGPHSADPTHRTSSSWIKTLRQNCPLSITYTAVTMSITCTAVTLSTHVLRQNVPPMRCVRMSYPCAASEYPTHALRQSVPRMRCVRMSHPYAQPCDRLGVDRAPRCARHTMRCSLLPNKLHRPLRLSPLDLTTVAYAHLQVNGLSVLGQPIQQPTCRCTQSACATDASGLFPRCPVDMQAA